MGGLWEVYGRSPDKTSHTQVIHRQVFTPKTGGLPIKFAPAYKKFCCRHKRQVTELGIVFPIIGNDDIAVGCLRTLVLKCILKVISILSSKSKVKQDFVSRNTRFINSSMPSCDHPVFGHAGFGIELHANLHHLFPLRLIREGIAILVYLLQGILGGAADLQLEDIRRVGCLILNMVDTKSLKKYGETTPRKPLCEG